MEIIKGKYVVENFDDIETLRSEFPLFDSIEFLIEDFKNDILLNGADERRMSCFKRIILVYKFICDECNIFIPNIDEMYNRFISEMKKNIMS